MDLIRVRQRPSVRDSSTLFMLGMSLAAVVAIGALVHRQMWHPRPPGNPVIPIEKTAPKPATHKVLTV